MLNQIRKYAGYFVCLPTPKSIIHPSLLCSLFPGKQTSTNCIFSAFLPSVNFGLTSGRYQRRGKEESHKAFFSSLSLLAGDSGRDCSSPKSPAPIRRLQFLFVSDNSPVVPYCFRPWIPAPAHLWTPHHPWLFSVNLPTGLFYFTKIHSIKIKPFNVYVLPKRALLNPLMCSWLME